jgi:predicted O-methyltransferase YrrM
MYLDSIDPFYFSVGWGHLGREGRLGYEEKHVVVGGQAYAHAFSAHAPSRLMFHLGARYSLFRAGVALNDDVAAEWSVADFCVVADGATVAEANGVEAGAPARVLEADVTGVRTLELIVRTSHMGHAHTVWLDPSLEPAPALPTTLVDALARAEVELRPGLAADLCIACVVTPGLESWVDDMLGSLVANGGCGAAGLFVFVVGRSEECEAAAAKHGASVIRCRSIAMGGTAIKSILYSVAHIVDARKYLCLDADLLVSGDVTPLFAALDVLPSGSILACRDCNANPFDDLEHALRSNYGGGDDDVALLEMTEAERRYRLTVNDGVFAGNRTAMLALDSTMRSIRQGVSWLDARPSPPRRNQFLFNLALARMNAGVAIDDQWNQQLHCQPAHWDTSSRRPVARWEGRPARIVHFTGHSKAHHQDFRGRYAAVTPLRGPAPGDGYADFLGALRVWLGITGVAGLRESFYGTTDDGVAVADVSVFPLLATLHYLIRSNGCIRVVECGTGQGVSAACIASAIAHRDGARVVTFDVSVGDDRDALWSTLPQRMQACIEARTIDSIAGLRAALEAGERFHAALLDSLGDAAHVLEEFQLATQVVSESGLILIHDATSARGTVGAALERIQRNGYNVVRLWAASEGAREDDRLGLAMIENRRTKADAGEAIRRVRPREKPRAKPRKRKR